MKRELKDTFIMSNLVLIFSNVLIIFLIRSIFLKKKILIDKINKPQSVSKEKDVVSIGGIILLINITLSESSFEYLIIFLIAIFLVGLTSDFSSFFNAKLKFVAIFIISLIFVSTDINFLINKTSIFFIDELLNKSSVFKIIFTSFCITLFVSGNNMIDGINGNAIGNAILVILTLSYIIYSKHNVNLLNVENIFFLLIALIVLFIFNMFSKVFLGDNGSYLLGAIMASKVIYLINIYDLNPFIASIILFYPCFEVLYSIIKKKNRFEASENHFHINLSRIFNKKNYPPFLFIFNINFSFMLLICLNYESDSYLKIILTFYFISLFFIYSVFNEKS